MLPWLRAFLALGFLVAAASAVAGSRWGEGYFPNVVVRNQDGKELRFYDDLIKGKIVVFSFIYTSCRDICPLTTARMAEMHDRLKDVLGRDIFMYTVTIDPERDTPDTLKLYAEGFQAGPGWQFITGRPEDIKLIRWKLGERSRMRTDHQNEVVLGNDRTGTWARDSAFSDLARLERTIREMDPAWQAPPIDAAGELAQAAKLTPIAGSPGQALFRKLCASCHGVGTGDRVGPDLKDVGRRRSRDWLTRFIVDPKAVHASGDAEAAALAARFTSVRMPRLGLSAADAEDVLAYLEDLAPAATPEAE